MPAYNLNRGINKSWEFQGLVGSNVYYLIAGIVLTFFLFVVLYFSVSLVLATVISFLAGGGMFAGVYGVNARYGEHGLMKAAARRSGPKRITNRQSRLFQH